MEPDWAATLRARAAGEPAARAGRKWWEKNEGKIFRDLKNIAGRGAHVAEVDVGYINDIRDYPYLKTYVHAFQSWSENSRRECEYSSENHACYPPFQVLVVSCWHCCGHHPTTDAVLCPVNIVVFCFEKSSRLHV